MVPIVNIEDLRQLARGYLPKAVFDFVDGGRQLDSAVSAVSALPSIVDAVGDRAEVILDGGVRRGIDVVKALCLGARVCMVGRPFLYGLAARGEAGVEKVIQIFRHETDSAMLLLGQSSLQSLNRRLLTGI